MDNFLTVEELEAKEKVIEFLKKTGEIAALSVNDLKRLSQILERENDESSKAAHELLKIIILYKKREKL